MYIIKFNGYDMKKIIMIWMVAGLGALFSCQDYYLQKPETSGTQNLTTIYSSRDNAFAILADCYRNSLIHGWPGGNGINHGTLGTISAERSRGYDWQGAYYITTIGLSPIYRSNYVENGADNYATGWQRIRACYLLIENIDKVPDMDQSEKDIWKAEAYGLIAYRYMGMFYRYGGLPKVEKSFEPGEEVNAPRMTLQQTLEFILNDLIQPALDGLPTGDRMGADKGRLTRGAVLAMKARVLQFAARPLFNTGAPYKYFGKNSNLICFGSADPSRWEDALQANLDVLEWAGFNNYYLIKQAPEGTKNNFTQAVEDYGKATSEPSNPEALLQYKINGYHSGLFRLLLGAVNVISGAGEDAAYNNDLFGMTTNMLEKYWAEDGSEPGWPKVGDPARSGTDWTTRINKIEARCRVDWLLPGTYYPSTLTGDHIAHPGVVNFRDESVGKSLANNGTADKYPLSYGYGQGPRAVKFWAANRTVPWTELPLFRLAETYLNLAEAYNELGQEANALKYLNEVHLRAGLPALSAVGKDSIRKLIQRERAVELQGENFRYFDAKHWKIADIANGGLCGPIRELQFHVMANWGNRAGMTNTYWDAVTFNSFWADYMYLEPFPIDEVNKGMVIQNPGY